MVFPHKSHDDLLPFRSMIPFFRGSMVFRKLFPREEKSFPLVQRKAAEEMGWAGLRKKSAGSVPKNSTRSLLLLLPILLGCPSGKRVP